MSKKENVQRGLAPAPGSADTPKPGAGQLGRSADESGSGWNLPSKYELLCELIGALICMDIMHGFMAGLKLWFAIRLISQSGRKIFGFTTAKAKFQPDAQPSAGQACPPNYD